jgi:hypothetical protein
MKPMFFKTQQDLMAFLQHCPRPEGQAKVQGEMMNARGMMERCISLIPDIFEYRKVLAKGPNGMGNHKSVSRYAEAAADNVSREKMEALDLAIAEIEKEVQVLLESGGSDGLADQLSTARTKVAYFSMMKASIEGFRDKLNKHMVVVEEKYADLSMELQKKQKELSKTLEPESVKMLMKEVSDKHQAVTRLVEAMDEYCAIQVGYAGICQSAR